MSKFTQFLLSAGVLAVLSIWLLTASQQQSDQLKIVFCNVGQGDATLISLASIQILVDGGPGKAVLDCLDKYLPLGDKTIELVIITHPDKDHIGGIIEVLQHYRVPQLSTIPIGKDTQVYKKLTESISNLQQSGQLSISNLYSGDKLRLDLLQATVLWPDRNWVGSKIPDSANLANGFKPSQWLDESGGVLGLSTTHSDINDFSLVLHIQYGQFDLLINGDAEASVQDDQLQTGLVPSRVEVITQPHHGSRNGLSDEWLEIVSPQLTVISSGANNRYGHPAPEILSRLQSFGSRILRTDQEVDIVIQTDGESWWVAE